MVGIALWFTLTITTYITPVIKQVSFDPEDSADSVHLAQVLSVLNSAATAMMLALIVGWLQQNLCFYQVGKLHGAS